MKNLLKIIPKYFLLLPIIIPVIHCTSSSKLPMGFEQNLSENNHPIGEMEAEKLIPQETKFYYKDILTGASDYLFVGENKDFKSIITCRFWFSSLPEPDSSRIQSVELILFPTGSIGDSTGQINLTAHKMLGANPDWSELQMTWSLFNNDYDEIPLSEPVIVTGTKTDSVAFKLDISQFTHADSTLDSTIIKTGLCILPNSNGNNNLIRRFYSSDVSTSSLKARLRIISTHNGVTDTTEDLSSDDAFVVAPKALAADSTAYLYLSKGISFRSMLKFDLSHIVENVTINRTRLKCVINRERSIMGLNETANFIAYPISYWPNQAQDVAYDSTNSGYSSTIEDDTLTVEIRGMVQKWTSNEKKVEGIFLQSLDESNDIQKLVLYGTEADSIRRPQLFIEYTTPPDFAK